MIKALIIVEDFNTLLSVIARITKQKVSKNVKNSSNIVNQLGLI